jgi:hypothetical protein
VILVGNGGPKQRHDAVAQHLVDGTLIAMHGVHHAVQGGVQELLGSFRVKAADELGRVLEVGKQHGHLFALAFQGGLRGADLLHQMRRYIRQRRPLLVSGWCRRGVPGPDQHGPLLVHGQPFGLDDFGLHVLKVFFIQIKPASERPV